MRAASVSKPIFPTLTGQNASELHRLFLDSDASEAPWNNRGSFAKQHGGTFKIRSIGRVYTLPPRKAPPRPHSPRLRPTKEGDSPPAPLILHSTLSPLTPSSPLYPDGLITRLWITKHQARLPSAFVAFFSLTSDANTSSLQDNKLKSEIANIRNILSTTNYKTKLVVVLIGENHIAPTELEERLTVLRRAAALDLKTCTAETQQEYNTSPTVPPSAGTSLVLPGQGWNVRYEFKLGVFAEFRQEMDAACRNYETAYESLFAPEVLESIASWSPRFNEARMLADIVAIRIIRCQLWTGQSTGAVRSWTNHRDRIKDLLERRGTGTDNYVWEAWRSTWSKSMAEIISRVDFSALLRPDPENSSNSSIFVQPEKALSLGERVVPWEQLHHEGYWFRQAQDQTRNRRLLAMKMPEEDRTPPGQSPASVIAKKAHLRDSYLALEPHEEYPIGGMPGYDYRSDITSTLQKAIEHYMNARQLRTAEHLQLMMAVEHMAADCWKDAMALLRPLWNKSLWRHGGWWKLLQEIGWALLECAKHLQDLETIIQLEWELSSRVFTLRQTHHYNLHTVLQNFDKVKQKPVVALVGEEVASSIIPSFAFGSSEGYVGEPIECQLSLRSCLQGEAGPIRLSEVKIVFEGSLRPVHLVMSDDSVGESSTLSSILDVDLHETSTMPDRITKRTSGGAIASLTGPTNLTMKPNQTKVFGLMLVPREAGDAKIDSVTMIVDDERFSLTLVTSSLDEIVGQWWEMRAGLPIPRQFAMEREPTTIKVLPRPPKLEISIPNLKNAYYTNEDIELQVNITNKEEDTANISVKGKMVSQLQHATTIRWHDDASNSSIEVEEGTHASIILPRRDISSLASSSQHLLRLLVSNTVDALDHEVEIAVEYSLTSEPDTPLVKVIVIELPIIRPFEANYEFLARLQPGSWPNFFELSKQHESITASGLKQQFAVVASVYSFAAEALIIESTSLRVQGALGDVTCQISEGLRETQTPTNKEIEHVEPAEAIKPDETQKFSFDMSLQKRILGDQKTAAVDLALDIKWRRRDSKTTNTSTLEIPTFIAPMAEPRILLAVTSLSNTSPVIGLYKLIFTIENPSMHFLTFNITMESSEDFAFSGPKASAVSLVPISRHVIHYTVLANKRGEWIKVNLVVVDAYFGKTLKVQPAGEGVKADKKGGVLVWVNQ